MSCARRGATSFLVPHFMAGAMPIAKGSGSPLLPFYRCRRTHSQTAGSKPASSFWRGALPIELRLRVRACALDKIPFGQKRFNVFIVPPIMRRAATACHWLLAGRHSRSSPQRFASFTNWSRRRESNPLTRRDTPTELYPSSFRLHIERR